MYYIEKWGFWSQFLCFVLKNEDFKKLFREKILFLCIILKNDVFEVHSFVLYWKMRNEDFLKLFPKKFCILMYYIEKWGYWSQFFCFILIKWGFLKNSFLKKIQSLCIIVKNEVFEDNSFVLYWKMRISKKSFPKNVIFLCILLKNDVFESNFMFCIEKWGMRIS